MTAAAGVDSTGSDGAAFVAPVTGESFAAKGADSLPIKGRSGWTETPSPGETGRAAPDS